MRYCGANATRIESPSSLDFPFGLKTLGPFGLGDSMRANLEYLHDMAEQLATLAEADGLTFLAYLFRVAKAEAELRLGRLPKRGDTLH